MKQAMVSLSDFAQQNCEFCPECLSKEKQFETTAKSNASLYFWISP
tara:strand:+ start:368 stop:505 length:138 start_codon:yes stop_codon:yes gene_type:complete